MRGHRATFEPEAPYGRKSKREEDGLAVYGLALVVLEVQVPG